MLKKNEKTFEKAHKAYQELLKYCHKIFVLFSHSKSQLKNNGVLKIIIKFISAELKAESELKLPFRELVVAYQNDFNFLVKLNEFGTEMSSYKNKLNDILVFIMLFRRANLELSLKDKIGNKYKDKVAKLCHPYLLAMANKDNMAIRLQKIDVKISDVVDILKKICIADNSESSENNVEKKINLVKRLIALMKSKPLNEENVELFLIYFMPEKNQTLTKENILPALEKFFTLDILQEVDQEFELNADRILCLLIIYYKCLCRRAALYDGQLKAEAIYIEEETNYKNITRPEIIKTFSLLKHVIVESKFLTEEERQVITKLQTHKSSLRDLRTLMPKESSKQQKSLKPAELPINDVEDKGTSNTSGLSMGARNEEPKKNKNYSRSSIYIQNLRNQGEQKDDNNRLKKEEDKNIKKDPKQDEDKGADKKGGFGYP